jgi:hypothetical protein
VQLVPVASGSGDAVAHPATEHLADSAASWQVHRGFLTRGQGTVYPFKITLDLKLSSQHHKSLPDAVETSINARILAHCQVLRKIDAGRDKVHTMQYPMSMLQHIAARH